eukprot:SAG31_NODE_1988_length_6721_cov_11.339928_3_plen_193_part_00
MSAVGWNEIARHDIVKKSCAQLWDSLRSNEALDPSGKRFVPWERFRRICYAVCAVLLPAHIARRHSVFIAHLLWSAHSHRDHDRAHHKRPSKSHLPQMRAAVQFGQRDVFEALCNIGWQCYLRSCLSCDESISPPAHDDTCSMNGRLDRFAPQIKLLVRCLVEPTINTYVLIQQTASDRKQARVVTALQCFA